LRSQRSTEERIKRMLTEHIFKPARMFKEGVSPRQLEDVFIEEGHRKAFMEISLILTAYPERYKFQKNSIYYDSKASPHNHFLAFFRMAQLLEHLGRASFNCFPLRRSWSPGYMQIDTRILCQQLLRRTWSEGADKLELWGIVVDLDEKAFRD
ncbi:hypothetical protein F4703DRAFT_1743524, partial [Phycomyces blakesleeanus]